MLGRVHGEVTRLQAVRCVGSQIPQRFGRVLAAQVMPQGRGVGGDQPGQGGAVLGVFRAGQEGGQLVGEVPGRIDQGTPLLPAFPPAVVGRVGPEHQQQTHDEAEQGVHGNRAVEVELLAVMQLDPRQPEGVEPKHEQHPDHLAERVAPVELENEGEPRPGVV